MGCDTLRVQVCKFALFSSDLYAGFVLFVSGVKPESHLKLRKEWMQATGALYEERLRSIGRRINHVPLLAKKKHLVS